MLSLGSIVRLTDVDDLFMIINRGVLTEEHQNLTKIFEYQGCIYPIGEVKEKTFFFNNKDIAEVVFEGYVDEEEKRFQEVYEKWIRNNNVEITSVKNLNEQAEKEHKKAQEIENKLFNN